MQLVCEGACNGSKVKEYDAIVAKTRRVLTSDGEFASVRDLLPHEIELGRSLIHTSHSLFEGDLYSCDTCGKTRRCGGSRQERAA